MAESRSRLAVLGSPIAHSKSPALHRAAYRVLDLPWSYDAIDVPAGSLEGFVSQLDESWRGLSLTMPLKKEVLALLSNVDAVARTSDAVNTLLLGNGSELSESVGFNTDVAGIVNAITAAVPSSVSPTPTNRVEILGGGATAASALLAAANLGAEQVQLTVRSPSRVVPLVELGTRLGMRTTASDFISAHNAATWPSFTTDLMISTLPGGTRLDEAARRYLQSASTQPRILLDVAYDPWPSALAARWEPQGTIIIPGLAMLVHQALIQVRIFVSGDPLEPLGEEERVLEAMREAARIDERGNIRL